MKAFNQYINEGAQPGKNLHLEHIEDEILNFGVEGGRSAINFLQALRDMLAGHSKSKVNISVKWDGAPAIFAGTDPEDGKFFVGTKGVFNKNPKLVKKPSDVKNFSAGLQDKLLLAFKTFSKLGIEGVLQGDLMYTKSDLDTNTIDGEDYITFQPNTIVYAVPTNSHFAKVIKSSKLGVVWHTTYSGGPTLADMTASFGANISRLRKSPDVWMDDASYRDVSGTVLFTQKETDTITRYLRRAGTAFQKINSRDLQAFLKMQESLERGASGATYKTYTNSTVRAGEKIKDARTHSLGYIRYFDAWWKERMIDAVKQERTKQQKIAMQKEYMRILRASEPTLRKIVEFQLAIVDAKLFILDKLNRGARRMASTFIRTADGYKVTPDEGLVVVDHLKGNAVKLVDRLEFSHNNFNAIKAWDR